MRSSRNAAPLGKINTKRHNTAIFPVLLTPPSLRCCWAACGKTGPVGPVGAVGPVGCRGGDEGGDQSDCPRQQDTGATMQWDQWDAAPKSVQKESFLRSTGNFPEKRPMYQKRKRARRCFGLSMRAPRVLYWNERSSCTPWCGRHPLRKHFCPHPNRHHL